MSYHVFTKRGQSFDTIRQGFLQAEELPLANAFSEEEIEQAFADPECLFGQDEDDVYTPALTLFGFLRRATCSENNKSNKTNCDRLFFYRDRTHGFACKRTGFSLQNLSYLLICETLHISNNLSMKVHNCPSTP